MQYDIVAAFGILRRYTDYSCKLCIRLSGLGLHFEFNPRIHGLVSDQ